MRTRLIRTVLLSCAAGAAAAGAGQVGCSSATLSPDDSAPNVGNTSSADKRSDAGSDGGGDAGSTGAASVTASWTLPVNEQITTLSWVLTHQVDSGSQVQRGSVSVSTDPATFGIADLAPDPSYKINVSGTSTDGATECHGSAVFAVQPSQTTNVSVTLACASANPDAGYAQVNGATYNCATANAVWASPSEVTVGHSVSLNASGTAPDPSSLTYAWSAPSGIFSSPSSASTMFTCTARGTVLVSVQLGDGPLPDGATCDPARSTITVPIACD